MGCCDAIAKYLLFILNFVVFVCGGVILGVGIALLVDDGAIDWITDITGDGDINDNLFRVAVYTMITVGSLLFVVGFFGCCGACKESSCMLQTYAVLVCILLLAEITGGILAAVFISEIDENIEVSMTKSVQERYSVEDTTTKAWDAMQIDLMCCGSVSYVDYANSTFSNFTENIVPRSCCREALMGEDGLPVLDDNVYKTCLESIDNGDTEDNLYYEEGCYLTFKDWVEQNSKLIMGILFGLGAVQLLCVIIACCLVGKNDDRGYTI